MDVIYTLCKAECFTSAAKLKGLACTRSEWKKAWTRVDYVNIVFSIKRGLHHTICAEPLHMFENQRPSTSVVWENAAVLHVKMRCEALEMNLSFMK